MADGSRFFAGESPNLSAPAVPTEPADFSDLPFGQLVGMGFRRENIIGALGELVTLQNADYPDDGFDPFADKYLEGYEQFASSFVGISSRAKAESVKRLIDRQQRDKEILFGAGGAGGLAMVLGALSDPTNLLPLANIRRVTRLGRAVSGAGRGAVVAGGQEAILQSAQVDRSGMESFANIGATSFLSGTISALIPGGVWKQDLQPEDAAAVDVGTNGLFRELRELEEATGEASIRTEDLAAKTTELDRQLDEIRRGIDKLEEMNRETGELFAEEGHIVPDRPRLPRSGGAAASPGAEEKALSPSAQRAQESLLKAAGLEKIPDNPLKRLLNSSELVSREVAQRLFENPYFLAKHTRGETSGAPVEAAIRHWWWPMVESINEIDRQYHLYRGADPAGGRMRTNARIWVNDVMDRRRGIDNDFMSLEDFRVAVTKAGRNGDEALDGNEFVTAAARAVREKVWKPMKDEATELQVWSAPLRREVERLREKMQRTKNASPELRSRITAEIRILEKEIQRLDTQGPEITTAKGFIPRFFRHDKIMADLDRFKQIIRDHLRNQVPPDVLEGEVQEMVERILREKPFRAITPDSVGTARSLRERSLPIPDVILEDFLENDIEALMRYYVRSTSADIELHRAFGSHDMADAIAEIEANYRARIDATKSAAGKKNLRDRMNADLRDIRAGRDRLRGTFGLPDDPYRPLSRFYRGVKQFNYMTMLGGVVISSIPDLGRLVMCEGVERAFSHAIIPWVRRVEALKLSLRETNIAGTALDLHLGFRAQAFAELGDTFGRHSRFERALMGGSSVFSVLNLFNGWNTVMKGMAGSVVAHRIGDISMRIARKNQGFIDPADIKAARPAGGKAGKAGIVALDDEAEAVVEQVERQAISPVGPTQVSEKDIAKLARAGIDPSLANRIGHQFQKHGEMEDGLMLPNTEAWDDAVAAEAYRMAVAQDVDRIIVTPGAGDRPLWVSTELGSVIAQFKSFSMASAQRVMIPAVQMTDRNVIYGVVMMLGLGMLVDELKRRQYGGPRPTSIRHRLIESFDRSGLSGYFMDINRIVERISDNKVGLNAMIGVPRPYAANFRSKIGAVAGPTADQMARAAGILTDFASLEYDRHTASALRRMMIGNNLFWASPVFDQIENAMRP